MHSESDCGKDLMGDRCYMELQCAGQDKALFEGFFYSGPGEIGDDNIARLSVDEANYAYGIDEMDYGELPQEKLASVPFMGSHSAGGSYPPADFACDGETVRYIDRSDGQYLIHFSDAGEPLQEDIERVRKFMNFAAAVREQIKERAKKGKQ